MGSSSSQHMCLKKTFLNVMTSDADWQTCEKLIKHKGIQYDDEEDISLRQLLYVTSGELSVYYTCNHREEWNLLKVLGEGDIYCLFDSTIFEVSKTSKLSVICTATQTKKLHATYISINIDDLQRSLRVESPIKSFISNRPALLMQSSPLFANLRPIQLGMIETAMDFVGVAANTTLLFKGQKCSSDGRMAVLLYGECASHSRSPPTYPMSIHSLHDDNGSRKLNEMINEIKTPLNLFRSGVHLRVSSPRIFPSSIEGNSSVHPLYSGSVIGAELCLQSDMCALTSVTTSTGCVIGVIDRSALENIDLVVPYTIHQMRANLNYAFLDGMRESVPLLWGLSNLELHELSMSTHVEYIKKDTTLILKGQESKRFYMIVSGEIDVTIGDSYTKALTKGQYFGEIGLTLSKTSTASIVSRQKSILLYMDNEDFILWFNRNEEAVAEANIRLNGTKVDPVHIVRHPRGYKAFLSFLQSQICPESLMFWKAVDELEKKCQFLVEQKIDKNLKLCRTSSNNLDTNGFSTRNSRIQYLASKCASTNIDPSMSDSVLIEDISIITSMCEYIMKSHVQPLTLLRLEIPATMMSSLQNSYDGFREFVFSITFKAKQGNSINLIDYKNILERAFILFADAKDIAFTQVVYEKYPRWTKTDSFVSFIQATSPYTMDSTKR